MTYDSWFDTDENKALLAICSRKLIGRIGIGGIIWGLINLVVGVMALEQSLLNIGVVALGLTMLVSGLLALMRPSLGSLLTATVVAVILLLWNLGISVLNFLVEGIPDPRAIVWLVFPLIIAVSFYRQYVRLQHIKEHIASVDPQTIKDTRRVCKALVKKNLKTEPSIIQSSDRKCRAQLMDDSAFFIQRDLMKAFVAPKDEIRKGIIKPDAKSLTVAFNHPLGKLSYRFDRKSSEKLKTWLSSGEAQIAGTSATPE